MLNVCLSPSLTRATAQPQKKPPAETGGEFRSTKVVEGGDQKSYLSANCITRGALWVAVILPKVAALNVRSGGEKKVLLVRLYASARKVRLWPSPHGIPNLFETTMSMFQ